MDKEGILIECTLTESILEFKETKVFFYEQYGVLKFQFDNLIFSLCFQESFKSPYIYIKSNSKIEIIFYEKDRHKIFQIVKDYFNNILTEDEENIINSLKILKMKRKVLNDYENEK
jgi:hypothetical protein